MLPGLRKKFEEEESAGVRSTFYTYQAISVNGVAVQKKVDRYRK